MGSKRGKYDGITPDARNANRGTERGRYMVEASLRETGAGRSILLDKDGRIVAGNKTFEAASDIGLPVRIVETDGTELVAVKRTDLDLSDDTGMARKLAYYDNRSSETSLSWDAEQVLADLDAGLDLSAMFRQDELDALIDDIGKGEISPAESNDRQLGDKAKQIKPVLYADELETFEGAILATGKRNRGAALIEICRFYLDSSAERQLDL